MQKNANISLMAQAEAAIRSADNEKAKKLLHQVLTLNPANIEADFQLAVCYAPGAGVERGRGLVRAYPGH
ncbi:MAG: hypothetical protein IPG66_15945 [Hydrogenophilales bacterium]|nr:hypothetical protein [Hydrogenophilales bacterium]